MVTCRNNAAILLALCTVSLQRKLSETLHCIDRYREVLDEESAQLLTDLEFDGIDCAKEAAASSGSLVLRISCGLPALLSLDIFCIAWEYRAGCLTSGGSTAVSAPSCSKEAILGYVASAHDNFHSEVQSAAELWVPPKGVYAIMHQCVREEAQNVVHVLALLRSVDSSRLFTHLLGIAEQLGLRRRVLQWRINQLASVAEFGLEEHVPLLRLTPDWFSSRFEILIWLLGGPPANGKQFVEIGVHLARLSFAILGQLPGLRYVGIDPYRYGPSTPPDSVAKQLQDLDLTPGVDAELDEVRNGAQQKFDLFANRAELWTVTSIEGSERMPNGAVDGVFIDGDHAYHAVAADIAAWEPKLRSGGFLSGHDFGHNSEVARAVLEYADRHNRTVHLAMDWVWYWRVP